MPAGQCPQDTTLPTRLQHAGHRVPECSPHTPCAGPRARTRRMRTTLHGVCGLHFPALTCRADVGIIPPPKGDDANLVFCFARNEQMQWQSGFRGTAGVLVNRLEAYTGYEYYDFDRVHSNALIAGVRVWF